MSAPIRPPVTRKEKEMVRRVERVGVETDILARSLKPCTAKAYRVAHEIAAIDWLYSGDTFGLKFAGVGDSGEKLILMLDFLFELQDKEVEIHAEENKSKENG